MNPEFPWFWHDRIGVWEWSKYILAVLKSSKRDEHRARPYLVQIDDAEHFAKNITSIVYRFIFLEEVEEPEGLESEIASPRYVSAANDISDEVLDLVVVDGCFRLECIGRVVPKIVPTASFYWTILSGGVIEPSFQCPPNWPVVNLSSNGLKQTCIWRRPA